MTVSFQVVLSALTVLGSLLGAFWGVRVSIARIEEKQRGQEFQLLKLIERVERLEQPHFQGRN